MTRSALPSDEAASEVLRKIRLWIDTQTHDARQRGGEAPPDLVVQGRRLLGRLDDWLLDDEQKQTLAGTPQSAFWLHTAALVCDIAAVIGPDPGPKSSRPERTRALIMASWRDMGLTDAPCAQVIARLCRRALSMTGTSPPASGDAAAGADTRAADIDFLAGGLALARALELKSPATLENIAARLSADAADVGPRMGEMFDVLQVGPHPHMPATIQVGIRCRHPEVHRALKHHERQVQQLLHWLNRHLRPRFLFSEVIYEISAQDYQPVDLKFTVDSSAALQLFMGQRLYSDKRVFLRELIQNALDACSLRRLSEADYAPQIAISFNEDISVITVQDNGIGMDRQWVEKYFLSIGISFYRSHAIQDMDRDAGFDIGFISQFGIGFLSSFLVAEKIVIQTRKRGERGLQITITGLKDYFDVRSLDEGHPVGTRVRLHLKPSKINFCRSLEYTGYLKTNLRFLTVPVRFTTADGRTTTIGREPLSYAAVKTARTDFCAALDFQHSEGYLYLGTKRHTDHIFALESASGGVSLFQDGIFVTHAQDLLPEGARQNVVGRINLRGADKCELSMDRNRIFWSRHQKQEIQRLVRHGLVDLANQVMAALHRQGVTGNTLKSVTHHLAIFFEFSDVDDDMHQALADPLHRIVEKRFRDFIRIHFAHTRRREGIPEAEGYNAHWQRQILDAFVHRN